MTLLQKIAEARVRFQSAGVKMSGKNDFAKYQYYELADILPEVNRLGKEFGFVCVVRFADQATMTIHDTESSEEIVFTSPMSTASLKGCHEVQNLGAVQTYIKRYLYQHAFEIVESDAINGTHNPNEKQPTQDGKGVADAVKRCGELSKQLGITDVDKKALMSKHKNNFIAVARELEQMLAARQELDTAADAAFGTKEEQIETLFSQGGN